MNIDHYRRLIAVAELGNFSKAAKQLHITQSALTQSIQSLEKTLGDELFVRNTRGVQLTPFGAALLYRARLIVGEHNNLRRSISDFHDSKANQLDIGVAPYLSNHVLPVAIESFIEKNPDVSIFIAVKQTNDLIDMLQKGEIEVAFCAASEDQVHEHGLHFDATLSLEYRLMARKSHPIFRKTSLTASDLPQYRWVVYDIPRVHQRITAYFSESQISPPKSLTTTNSLSMMRTFALSTDAIVLMSTDYAANDIQRGDLRVISFSELRFKNEAGLLSVAKASQGKTVSSFVRSINAACTEMLSAS